MARIKELAAGAPLATEGFGQIPAQTSDRRSARHRSASRLHPGAVPAEVRSHHEVRRDPAFCQEQVAEALQQGQVASRCRSWGGGVAQNVGAKGIFGALRGGAGG